MALHNRRGGGGGSTSSPNPTETVGYTGKMPLYALGVNNRGFAVAGGGGGASKTGIPNGLIFFKYSQEKIEKIGEHNTIGDAITSLDVHPEENVALFVDTDKFAQVQFAAGGTVLKSDTVANSIAKTVKVLRFSPDASKVVVGCFDGPLHTVSYPALTTTASAPQAHEDDVDDVAWDPTGKFVASASKDKKAKVWKVTPGNLAVAQTLTCAAEGTVLMPRGCRFSPTAPNRLYVSAFIVSKATYIFAFNSETGVLVKKAKIHNYHSASFAINVGGTYVGVGDVDGTVVIADAESLCKVLQVKVHGFFVPALAFTLPIKTTTGSTTKKREKVKEATNDKKEGGRGGAVISVGADYACMLTPIVHQSFVNIQLVVFVASLIVVLLAILIRAYVLK